MPWQGHLFIGQKVHDYGEVIEIFQKLGVTELDALGEKLKSASDENTKSDIEQEVQEALWDMSSVERTIHYKGVDWPVRIDFAHEGEGGADFPVDKDERYTDAAVCFHLTQRYRGAILDFEDQHGGRHEPFAFDPLELQEILVQVRSWWPDAQVLIWTVFY
jgi:hypothetical protein